MSGKGVGARLNGRIVTSVTDAEMLDLVVRAGGESARRGYVLHRDVLRALYRALRSGLVRSTSAMWPMLEDLVVEWARALKVPPFDGAAEDGTGNLGVCIRCKAGKGGRRQMRVELRWRSGSVLRCSRCGHAALSRQGIAPQSCGSTAPTRGGTGR